MEEKIEDNIVARVEAMFETRMETLNDRIRQQSRMIQEQEAKFEERIKQQDKLIEYLQHQVEQLLLNAQQQQQQQQANTNIQISGKEIDSSQFYTPNKRSGEIPSINTATNKIDGMPTSCDDLWQMGHDLSGFYSVKGDQRLTSVYCDFSLTPGDPGNNGDQLNRNGFFKFIIVHFYSNQKGLNR